MYGGKKIKAFRQYLDISQEAFSEKLAVSQPYYSSIENGKKKITKKLMSSMQEMWGLNPEYFTSDVGGKIEDFMGVKNGGGLGDMVNDEKTTQPNAMDNRSPAEILFPPNYWDGNNAKISGNFERKLIQDISKNYKEINELYSVLNLLQNLEFIIGTLNYHYFSDIELQFHSAVNYFKNGSFDYEKYRDDFFEKLSAVDEIKPVLTKFSKAIYTFFDEMKQFDKKKIISGYLTEEMPETQS